MARECDGNLGKQRVEVEVNPHLPLHEALPADEQRGAASCPRARPITSLPCERLYRSTDTNLDCEKDIWVINLAHECTLLCQNLSP